MNHDIWLHPFKQGIYSILKQHFADEIVDRFRLDFEKEIYSTESIHIWRQIKDDKLMLEVKYKTGYDTWEYICDLFSDWSKKKCEYVLLKHITDKYVDGKIRFDTLRSSKPVQSKEFETHDDIVLPTTKEVKKK